MRKTTVELGNLGAQEFDATGARALTMMLDREYRAEYAPTDGQREFWTAAADSWRRFALECWTYAAECAAEQAGT